jgi:hypothetical protein
VLHRKQLYLACFCFHFLFILSVCCRDTFYFIAQGHTWLPAFLNVPAQKAENVLSTALGSNLEASSPFRQTVNTYGHLGGIESGYAYFAPNVPNSYKLVFELHYPDGRIEYDLPYVSSRGAGLRFATLLDNLGDTPSDELREVMVKMVAYSVWRAHPDATMIRAVLGFSTLPTAAQFRRGIRESNEFLYAYDFLFPSSSSPKNVP